MHIERTLGVVSQFQIILFAAVIVTIDFHFVCTHHSLVA